MKTFWVEACKQTSLCRLSLFLRSLTYLVYTAFLNVQNLVLDFYLAFPFPLEFLI